MSGTSSSTDKQSTVELLSFALELADAADAITLPAFRAGGEVQHKRDGSLVTEADKAAERELKRLIETRFPAHSVLGEEHGQESVGGGSERWILDPIDGTSSFVRGIPAWGTLVACERAGVVVVGVASAPALGTRWWAGRGLGAYRGRLYDERRGSGAGERISVSDIDRVEEAQVLFGSFRAASQAWRTGMTGLLESSWRQRSFGDFWGHCLVADGSAELMIDPPSMNPWDIAALLPIVEEAGGRISDVGGATHLDVDHVISSNGMIHDQVLRVLRGDEPPPASMPLSR